MRFVSLLILLFALPTSAQAAESLLICYVGGPGGTKAAQPNLDRFLRHMESVSGLEANTLVGEYHTRLDNCRDYVREQKPTMVAVDLATYLSESPLWGLVPFAHMGKPDQQRYHVLAQKGAFADLAALSGKGLASTQADLDFVSRIVFAGAVDANEHFEVKKTRRALKGVRKVARGKTEATLVDDFTFRELANLGLPAELASVHTSEGLPGLTLATLGEPTPTGVRVRQRLGKALGKICTGDAKEMCDALQVDLIRPASARLFERLEDRYWAGRARPGQSRVGAKGPGDAQGRRGQGTVEAR